MKLLALSLVLKPEKFQSHEMISEELTLRRGLPYSWQGFSGPQNGKWSSTPTFLGVVSMGFILTQPTVAMEKRYLHLALHLLQTLFAKKPKNPI